MRKRISRGKSLKTKEWVYGYYCELPKDCKNTKEGEYPFDSYIICENQNMMIIKVDRDTVGEFIGIQDISGTDIYENDYVLTQEYFDKPYSSKAKGKRHIGLVEFYTRSGNFPFLSKDKPSFHSAGWRVKINDYGKFTVFSFGEFLGCKVIGNTTDNPEYKEK